MKKRTIQTLIALVLLLTSLQTNAQVKEFEKYSDTKNVTYVYISKFMLGMAGKLATPSVAGVNTKSIMNKLSGIQIITSEDKTAAARLKSDTQDIVKRGKYERLMQVDEEGEKVRIYHCEGKKQSAVVMQVEEKDELTVIVFSGKFTLDDVMKMTNH
ncbi:MAG: DUF4252 domain-containing protein [Prevotella sp.]|nr:DUF4252 domain-containing protein [Prevotella sp.]MBR7042776.1 DUF4252 domain-containing protein [Prevotella sp.]